MRVFPCEISIWMGRLNKADWLSPMCVGITQSTKGLNRIKSGGIRNSPLFFLPYCWTGTSHLIFFSKTGIPPVLWPLAELHHWLSCASSLQMEILGLLSLQVMWANSSNMFYCICFSSCCQYYHYCSQSVCIPGWGPCLAHSKFSMDASWMNGRHTFQKYICANLLK